MSRVLVTGGAGFIGSHTVDLLLERGYEVRIIDSLQPRVHPFGKPAYVPNEAEFIQGDVSNPDDMRRALDNVEFVIHLAAYQDYLPDFTNFIHTNAESCALIFELAVADPRRFPLKKMVFASSQSVSGEGKYRCLQEDVMFWPGPRALQQLERGEWDIPCPQCRGAAEPRPRPGSPLFAHDAVGGSRRRRSSFRSFPARRRATLSRWKIQMRAVPTTA